MDPAAGAPAVLAVPTCPPASPAPPDCPAQPGPARQSQAAAGPGHRRRCRAGASPRPGVLTPSAGKIQAQNTSEVILEKGKEREETKKNPGGRSSVASCRWAAAAQHHRGPAELPVLAPVPAGPPLCAGASSCWVRWRHLQRPR